MTELSARLGDITATHVDAIVNAANNELTGGSGVNGAIHRAGGPAILAECRGIVARQGPVPTGRAVATGAGRLPASYVIHTVGPVWSGEDPDGEDRLLASCYAESLALAASMGARSIAFPAISTGVYGFPGDRAAPIAVAATRAWLSDSPDAFDRVVFVCFDGDDLERYTALLG